VAFCRAAFTRDFRTVLFDHVGAGGSDLDDFEDMIDDAPCGYVTLLPNGRVAYVNNTLLGWTGYAQDQMTGKRFTDFLSMAGRIYYETHIAPLLRMQGSFNGFAIDIVSANGEPLEMISSAAERRDAIGKALSTRLALILARDRKLYERQLLQARDKATVDLAHEREVSELREQFIAVLGRISATRSRQSAREPASSDEVQRQKKSTRSLRCWRPP
jgi:phosphoserine phosphatase RsbU/P